jgi:hypothetical protein
MFDYSKLNDYSKRKRGKNRDEVRAIDAQRKAHIAAQNAPKIIESTPLPLPGLPDHVRVVKAHTGAAPAYVTADEAVAHLSAAPATMEGIIRPFESAIEVPANWRDLNWPQTRDLAAKIVGRDPASRSEARAILAAHANKGA